MSATRRKKAEPQSTRQRLQGVIKESRNVMRKDAGLNGELDRLPQLAWLLFLRAFDDFEEARQVTDKSYTPAIDGDYRWSAWARGTKTGEPLLAFVNDDLLPHLRKLQGSGKPGDPRDTLAQIFADVTNRMLSGFLLKDLVSQLDKISFTSHDDIHTMAHMYESMLKEMRDAAGDSGEFYTPRPLVRFIVDMVDPQVGEKVLDPAMGTGGFLVEAFEHLMEQATTAKQRTTVKESIRGIEKKPMPLLLAQMNLLLHEIDQPRVVRQNALAVPIKELRADPVDVILTNPPFGGEEEAGILTNFPSTMRTAETVWLFLQSVIARLERSKDPHARCGIVVPNSVLFDQGVGAKIKSHLMANFNLHTVVRLPNGVFAPYTLIPSNVLFFDKGPQDDHIWFYEHPLPEGRKNYTKTKPLMSEEFAVCAEWWGGRAREGRVATDQAWQVATADVVADGYNLDLRNPHRPDDLTHRDPQALVADLHKLELGLVAQLDRLKRDLVNFTASAGHESAPLRRFLTPVSGQPVDADRAYEIAGVYSFGRGLLRRPTILGSETKYKTLTRLPEGAVVYSKLGAFEGAVAVVGSEFAGSYVSPEFPTFAVDGIDIAYLEHYLVSPAFKRQLSDATAGVGARQKRVAPESFLDLQIPFPRRPDQRRIAALLGSAREVRVRADEARVLEEAILPATQNHIFNATR